MIRIAHTVTIDRPITEVFAFASTPSNLPQWQTHIQGARTTSAGPLRVGATFREESEIGGQPVEAHMCVTAYAPPQHFAVRSVAPGPMTVAASYRYEPTDGGTQVHALIELHMSGWRRLLQPLMARSARADIPTYLTNLKRSLETRPPKRSAAPDGPGATPAPRRYR